MKELFSFLFRYSPKMMVFAGLFSIITGAANTALLGVVNQALARFEQRDQILILTFVILAILLPITRIVSQVLLAQLTQKGLFDLRINLSRQILDAPLRALEEHGANKLLAAFTDDLMRLTGALVNLPFLIMHLTVVASCMGYLIWLYWPAGLMVCIALIFGVGTYMMILGKAQSYNYLARDEADSLFKHFQALIYGSKELKLHRARRDSFIDELLATSASAYRRHVVTGSAWFAGAGSLGQLLFFLVIGILVFLLPRMLPLSAETVTGYTIVLLYLTVPLDNLTNIIPNLGGAHVSLRKIQKLGMNLERVSSQKLPSHKQALTEWTSLSYKNIEHEFYHEGEEQSFKMGPLSLDLKPGEIVFLIGGNGSGKTTLGKILVGLYAPMAGEIFLNGEPVSQDSDFLRQHFSAIFSDFFLFDRFLGLGLKQDEVANQLLKNLQLAHKVQIQDGNLSTLNLSQGQRKRLALLTAYLEDRPIYLFDEWAADQDPVFRKVFYQQLLPQLKKAGKTVLAITHDDHYFEFADRIIKLDYGQIEHDSALNTSS